MATVALTQGYIHLASDPSQMVAMDVTSGLNSGGSGSSVKTNSPFVNGSVNFYAGGGSRVVTQPGVFDSVDVTFGFVDLPTRTTLRGWTGQVVCYIDPVGEKVFGTYLGLKVTAYMGPNLCDVEVTIQTVSWQETV